MPETDDQPSPPSSAALVAAVKKAMELPECEQPNSKYPNEARILDELGRIMTGMEAGDMSKKVFLEPTLGNANSYINDELREMQAFHTQVEAYRKDPESTPDYAKDSEQIYVVSVQRHSALTAAQAALNARAQSLMPTSPRIPGGGRRLDAQAEHGGGIR